MVALALVGPMAKHAASGSRLLIVAQPHLRWLWNATCMLKLCTARVMTCRRCVVMAATNQVRAHRCEHTCVCVCEPFSLRKLSSNRNSCAMLIVQVLSIATLKWLKATPQHATPLVLPSVRRTCSTRLTPCLLVLQPPSRYSSWCVLQVYCCMVGKGRRPMPTGRRRRLLRLAVSQVCRTVTSWFLLVREPVVDANCFC